MLVEEKSDRKFRFVEDFPDYQRWLSEKRIEAMYAGEEFEDEIKPTKTNFFGTKYLRQIAKVDWREVSITREVEKKQPNGKVVVEEETVTMYEEIMGEMGGWLEYEENLSQKGECWVYPDSFIMGGARVSGDAEIRGGAEIGDSAKVSGYVKLDGEFGIGGNSEVTDYVRITGKKRMAVFGNAYVFGYAFIQDEAKVYGNATVGTDYGFWWKTKEMLEVVKQTDAVVRGKARVYGESVVDGWVSDNAEVFGHADVHGMVGDDALVGGTASVGQQAVVKGKAELYKGTVNGVLYGDGIVAWPKFNLAVGSKLELKAEKWVGEERRKREKKDEKERDKEEDRRTPAYAGEVKSLEIGERSDVRDCEFIGDVAIEKFVANKCKLTNVRLVDSSYMNYAEDSELENCNLYGVRLSESTLKNVVDSSSPTEWISKSTIEDSTILYASSMITGCTLKNCVVAAPFIVDKNFEDTFLAESKYGIWALSADAYSKYKKWYGHEELFPMHGFTISVYEYKFEQEKDETLGAAVKRATEKTNELMGLLERILYAKYKDQRELVVKERERVGNERKGMIEAIAAPFREEKAAAYAGYGTEASIKYKVLARLVDYFNSILSLDFSLMSEESYIAIYDAARATADSYDGDTFTPYYNYGEITLDKEYEALEEKLRAAISFY